METLRIAHAYTVYPAIVFLVLSLSPTYLSSDAMVPVGVSIWSVGLCGEMYMTVWPLWPGWSWGEIPSTDDGPYGGPKHVCSVFAELTSGQLRAHSGAAAT